MARYNSRVAKGLGYRSHRSRPARWYKQRKPYRPMFQVATIPQISEYEQELLRNESICHMGR